MFGWLADKFWRWRHARPGPWERGPRAHGLFPAYSDWGAGMAVDQQGEVWCSEDPANWTNPAIMEDPVIRFAALGVAVCRHRELVGVAPVRAPDDPVCPTCYGRGYPAQLPAKLRYFIICQCGGLGWIPRGLVAKSMHDSSSSIDAPAS